MQNLSLHALSYKFFWEKYNDLQPGFLATRLIA